MMATADKDPNAALEEAKRVDVAKLSWGEIEKVLRVLLSKLKSSQGSHEYVSLPYHAFTQHQDSETTPPHGALSHGEMPSLA